jgi:type I restriction enzyme M protein
MTGDELLNFCNNRLFPGLKELRVGTNGHSRGHVLRNVFEDAYKLRTEGINDI